MENTKRGGVEKMPESGTLDKILNRIGQLDDKFSTKFEKIDGRFDKVDEKFDEINERFNKVDGRFDNLDDRLDMIYDQTVRLTLGQTVLKRDISEIKSVFNYLNNEVARNSKDIYVIKNGQN
jgi:predicted nuclease with TOPRIM domain